MILTTPRRLITLHLSHLTFTEAFTFMTISRFLVPGFTLE